MLGFTEAGFDQAEAQYRSTVVNAFQNVADALLRHQIDGVIATNTTITRDAVQGLPHGEEAGGLSGKPVLELSNQVIRGLKAEVGEALPIIGVGGVQNADDAWEKLLAGASLLQIYSALVYSGPTTVRDILLGLQERLAGARWDDVVGQG